jgi:hypothetical protein
MSAAPSPPRGSARPLAVVVICAIVLASAFAGVAVDRIVLRRSQVAPVFPDTGFHPLSSALRTPTLEDRRRLRAELTRELGLTAAQDSAVDAIMTRRAGEFSALRDEIRPRVEQLVANVRGDVEQLLTPAQREQYRRLQNRGGDDSRRMSSSR